MLVFLIPILALVAQLVIFVFVCRTNVRNARMRNRSGLVAVCYTFVLWIGLGLCSACLFKAAFDPGDAFLSELFTNMLAVFIAHISALIGAFASRLLSKQGYPVMLEKNNLTPEQTAMLRQSPTIASPCSVTVALQNVGPSEPPAFVQLNGQFIGQLRPNQPITAETQSLINIVTAGNSDVGTYKNNITFEALPGGHALLFLSAQQFLPDQTVILPY